MDQSTALAELTALTAGLVPTAETSEADLRAVREALAGSLLRQAAAPGEASPGLPAAPAATPSPDVLTELGDIIAAAAGPAGPVPLVVRRSLPAPVPGHPELTSAAVAGMLPQSIGPFTDQLGASHWFDLFPVLPEARQTAISRASAPGPFLLLPLTLPAGPVPATLQVDAGSLWIQADLLAPGSPAGGYAGLAISGGTLDFSAPPATVAGGIDVAAAATVMLTVTLDAPAGPLGGAGPGADGGAVTVQLPDQVTFLFTQANAEVAAFDGASLTTYGATVSLAWEQATPAYEPALGQLLVPLAPGTATFTPASVRSTLFQPSGTAPVQAGAWALPVAVTAPAQLGTAATAGQLVLRLGTGLSAAWPGAEAGLGQVYVSGAAGVLTLLGSVDTPNQAGMTVDLWTNAAPSTARSSADVTLPNGELVYYASIASYAGASHTEIIAAGAVVAAHTDRPVTADASRLGPTLRGTLVIYQTATASAVLIWGLAPLEDAPLQPIALALRNSLLVTNPPTRMLIAGTFTATPAELDSGGLLLAFGLRTLLPTLPDPYAANFLPQLPGRDGGATAVVTATVLWSPAAAAQLSFGGGALTEQNVRVAPLPATAAPPPGGETGAQDQRWRAGLQSVFNKTLVSPGPALFLLDVSSNVDQFGVGLASPGRGDLDGQAALAISGLDLVAPCLGMRVFTAPAVQWEPVRTIQNPKVQPSPFPSPAGFLDDGGPTLLGATDVTLVPVAPAPLLDHVISAYDGGRPGAALFTLPFGMVAVATLPARPKIPSPLFRRPGLAEVQPGFAAQNMTGGRQVSLTAPPRLLEIGGSSTPALPGATVQLRNLVDGAGHPELDGPAQLSVLGPAVDTVFNGDFAPGEKEASVPVSRIDFSGYGASGFSAWTDPDADPPAVVQVRFNMMVGRASHEVVQIKSMMYPWGAIFVRTITIDRQDDAGVYRYDSGWVAATPGLFGTAGITVHPGSVRGAYNIRQISETTQTYTSPTGAQLTGVYFDADLQIDGVLSGGAGGLVPSTGQFGFVQTAPDGVPLSAADLADLITHQGSLGGPVDCVISVGGTAQTMRVSRVEVGNAPHTGAAEPHEFAAAVRGSVALPQPGHWSILTRTDDVSEPTPVGSDLAVPMIRQGPAGGPASTSPWRLAEPVDLWTPDAPSVDYCLLHTTDSTRIMFPRPELASGATAFTSDQVPLLADGFALLEATSVFPRQDGCLAFPDASYELQISAAGAFTLAGVPATFPPSHPQRTLATSSAGTIGFEYADPSGTPARISVAISPTAWSVGLEGVNVRLDITPFNGLMRTTGNVRASSGGGVAFQDGKLVLGSALAPLQDLLMFLAQLGLPNPLSLAFSNGGWTTKYKLQAGLQFPLGPIDTPLGSAQLMLKTGFGNTAMSAGALTTASSQWNFFFSFSGNIQVPVFPPIKAGGLLGLGISINFPAGSAPQSEQLSFQAGVIASVGGTLIPGLLTASISLSLALTLAVSTGGGATSVTIGAILVLAANGKILGGLVGITFTAEASGAITVTVPRSVSATFDISVDVQLCWFLDVSFSESVQYTQSLP
jgi:hypothetical protein